MRLIGFLPANFFSFVLSALCCDGSVGYPRIAGLNEIVTLEVPEMFTVGALGLFAALSFGSGLH